MRNEKHPLEYATPLPEAVRRQRALAKAGGIVLVVLSIPLGFFGLLSLTLAIWQLTELQPTLLSPPLIAIFLLLGLVSLVVCMRWLGRGMRMATGEDVRRRHLH